MHNDRRTVFLARTVRTFGFGLVSIVLPLYLARQGLSVALIGASLSLTLIEDAVATVAISGIADRWGRRRTLTAAPLLITATGAALALVTAPWALMLVVFIGVFSPGGVEAGPFMAVEQAVLSHETEGHARTKLLAWYNVAGSLAAALGALTAGALPVLLVHLGWADLAAWRAVFWLYAALGLLLALLARGLSSHAEVERGTARVRLGLHRSRGIVMKLASLQGVDALAGGLVVQSLVAWWFHVRFGVDLKTLGQVFFGTNLLSALSFLAAAGIAKRFGLLNTMVFTHLPSNMLLCLVPFMPTLPLAAGVLLARHALSQMDVPTRQAYTMALVDPDERSAAAGFTASVRSTAAAVSPAISGAVMGTAALGWPFIASGLLKSAYDIALWLTFRGVRLPEEEIESERKGVKAPR